MSEKKWLVFYTKSRHEEKVNEYLTRRGYEVFLPMQGVVRQWSDRKKKVMVPLFRSYIFVHDSEHRIEEIVQAPGIAWNVRYNNRPAELRHEELETIQLFLATGLFVETVAEADLEPGEHVEVIGGPLKGVRGRIVHSPSGDKFSVTLAVLGNSMVIKLDSRLLKRTNAQINE